MVGRETVTVVHIPHQPREENVTVVHIPHHTQGGLSPLYTPLTHTGRRRTVTVVHTSHAPRKAVCAPLYTPLPHPGRHAGYVTLFSLPTQGGMMGINLSLLYPPREASRVYISLLYPPREASRVYIPLFYPPREARMEGLYPIIPTRRG